MRVHTRIVTVFSILLTTIQLACPNSVIAGDFGLPENISILGENLILKEQQNHGQQGFIAEYIQADKTWDNWEFMFAIRFIPGSDMDPIASAQATADNINALKAVDPIANSAIYINDDKTEAIVDFLVSGNEFTIFEHNVWRYFRIRDGMISYQIARRIYVSESNQEESKDFIRNVANFRKQIINEISNSSLPIPIF